VTGSGQGIPKDLGTLIGRVRAQTDLPLAVGFGITSAETVKEVAAVADAVGEAAEAAEGEAGEAARTRQVHTQSSSCL
jgi:tryptophan synthase alpha chain